MTHVLRPVTSRVLVRQLRCADEVGHASVKRAALPMPESRRQVMKQLHELCGWDGSPNGIVAGVVHSVKGVPMHARRPPNASEEWPERVHRLVLAALACGVLTVRPHDCQGLPNGAIVHLPRRCPNALPDDLRECWAAAVHAL